jgi:DNA-binding NarL/FixJ family response regulator
VSIIGKLGSAQPCPTDKGPKVVPMSMRVLVVEDFAPFRQFVTSTLGRAPDLQVIGEVSDGLEAVQKAEELKPDLILLDIGLPTLNGIEAARQIRKLSPQSTIVFVSQESSTDVVQEALSLGASAYVLKARAAIELLPVVNAVLFEKQSGHDTEGAASSASHFNSATEHDIV